MSNILNNILKNARDTSGSLLSAVRLKGSKSANFRPFQAQSEPKFIDEDNADLPGVGSSWTSLKDNSIDESLLDQSEKIISYYRNRFVLKPQPHADVDPSETNEYIDGEISETAPESVNSKDGKSLYNLMATRKINSRSFSIDRRSKKTRPEESILPPLPDQYSHQNTYYLPESSNRERCFNKLRQSISSPTLWGSGKSRLDCSPISLDENASKLLTSQDRKIKSKRRNPNRHREKSSLKSTSANQDDEDGEPETQPEDKFQRNSTMPTIKSQQGLPWKISNASMRIPSNNTSILGDQVLLT